MCVYCLCDGLVITKRKGVLLMNAAKDKAEQGHERYQRSCDGRDYILRQLRKRGFRVTRQREVILDAILNYECTSCKEIYYQAVAKDPGIGMATVYRMVNTLTDIGVLKVASLKPAEVHKADEGRFIITMKDESQLILSNDEMISILKNMITDKGYAADDIIKVELR